MPPVPPVSSGLVKNRSRTHIHRCCPYVASKVSLNKIKNMNTCTRWQYTTNTLNNVRSTFFCRKGDTLFDIFNKYEYFVFNCTVYFGILFHSLSAPAVLLINQMSAPALK